jgi:hypothetical protein
VRRRLPRVLRIALKGWESESVVASSSLDGPNERGAMRRHRLVLVVIVASLGLVALPVTVAANPDINHFSDSGTFTDTDFCGTGMTVEVAFEVSGTEALTPNGPTDYWQTAHGVTTFTNPLNGNMVINRFADRVEAKIISGDPETGTFVEEVAFKGLPEQLLVQGSGGLLLRDVGIAVFRNTWVDNELVSSEPILERGPHPDLESDFEAFCEVTTDALGL